MEQKEKEDFAAASRLEHHRLDSIETTAVLRQQMKAHRRQQQKAKLAGEEELRLLFDADKQFEVE